MIYYGVGDNLMSDFTIQNYWKVSFSKVLQAVSSLYSVTPMNIAGSKFDVTTVRKWIKGTRIPSADGQKHLINYFRKLADENDSEAMYLLMCEQMENCLSDVGLSSFHEIKKACEHNTSALVTGVLRLCFLKMQKPRQKSSEKMDVGKVSNISRIEKTKAVVFDFDGTLTTGNLNRTTWEDLWIALGYDVNYCKYYHQQFSDGIIDHPTWCKITEDYFKKRNLHRQTLDSISNRIKLLPGVDEVLKFLYKNDIKIYIVSGSILHVIRSVMKENYIYIDGIKANHFFFNINGFLEEIVGTKYDFEGKANFIVELAEDLHISASEILFVGNSINDEFAYTSGARTLCINPKNTDSSNTTIWNRCILKCTNLNQILPFI